MKPHAHPAQTLGRKLLATCVVVLSEDQVLEPPSSFQYSGVGEPESQSLENVPAYVNVLTGGYFSLVEYPSF